MTSIRGSLIDDAGVSLDGTAIELALFDSEGKPATLRRREPCSGSSSTILEGTPGSRPGVVDLRTGTKGAFCVRVEALAPLVKVRVSYPGSKLIDGAERSTEVSEAGPRRTSTRLRFENAPSVIDLERPSAVFTLTIQIDRASNEDAPRERGGLAIELRDERGSVVASGQTAGDGRARIELSTSGLDGPGEGALTARFAGTAELSTSEVSTPIVRATSTRVEAPSQIEGDPSGGLLVEVRVTTARGAAHGGVVEAMRDGVTVGAGAVAEDGVARASLLFTPAAAGPHAVSLRYIPSSSAYRASEPVDLLVLVPAPSTTRQFVLGLAGVALVAWIVSRWRRAPKQERSESLLPPEPTGRSEVLVVERPAGIRGWRGVVVDAHDGQPVPNADVQILRPTFDGDNTVARCSTDDDGRFELSDIEVPREAKLCVDADLHARYEIPMPGPSVLRVTLVTRRRALLDRLVRWARLHGTPFDSTREPTPGHVRRAASRAGERAIESWAGRVESTAFGPSPVTRRAESTVGSEPRRAP